MVSEVYVENILKRDKKIFKKDYRDSQNRNLVKNKTPSSGGVPLIADFTEYSPLHNGHYHCMKTAKEHVPDGLFVAVVPGLFERSGRGLPYILPREVRAEIAVNVGADIVVEGPPMGIMGSGQYSLCLCKMFQALNTDYIPRGYNPSPEFSDILKRISMGHAVVPKPYKIVDTTLHETVFKGKLAEDNYVICSFSKSLNKIGFDFKDKFIFVPRIEGVSGTRIREAIVSNELDSIKDMVPSETLRILKREIENNHAPLHNIRNTEEILKNVNSLSYGELSKLNFFTPELTKNIILHREEEPFTNLEEVLNIIPYGFSTHYKHRVLSILETKVNNDIISNYIETYPFNIRVLNYKNEHVLEDFKNKIINDNRRIKLWR
ncbi:nucleotidyltransferase family protein [Methanobrevibacter sp. UBA412]|jgi:predicted nucleotidyltransferase|uniref:nucleotidyltransferase family protein n=1 Tax=Methanobrevibacter sp. UBA412 TaxID=1915486 RepID=UPI0039B881EB